MAQWIRICQCRGHGLHLWSGKSPRAAEQLSSCWPQLPSHSAQSLRSSARRHRRGKPGHHREGQPCWPQQGKDHAKPLTASTAAKSLQSCPALCGPRDGSPPGSPVPGILQARTLEWVAISFSERKLNAEELMLLNCGVGEDS